jgi:hypothetical protein
MSENMCAVRLVSVVTMMAPFLGSRPLMLQPAAGMAVTPQCCGWAPEAAACDQGSDEMAPADPRMRQVITQPA